MHDLVGLHRIGFLDADKDQVVKHPLGGEGNVHDLGKIHLKDREKQLHTGRTDVEILHRRNAHDRRGINSVLTMRDRRHVKDWVGLLQRVESSMIPKRPLHSQWLGRIHITFDDKVGICGHLKIVGEAFDQFHRPLSQITRQ